MDRHSPGRILAAIARAPRAAGRGVRDLLWAIVDAVAAFWSSLSVVTRRRLVAAVAAAVAGVLFFALLVPNLPCGLPGGDFCAPEDDAVTLVPADALVYVHANLDPDEEDYDRATEVAERVPVVSDQVAERVVSELPRPIGRRLDFEADIEPWFGGEIAYVALPGSGQPTILIEAADSDGAEEFAGQISVGVPRTEEVEGVEVRSTIGGLVTAQADGFLIVGDRAGVRAVAKTAVGSEGAESLQSDPAANEARDELPEHRFAEIYLAGDGVRRFTARGEALASLTPLLAPGDTRGAAVSLTATDDGGLELAVRSVLDAELQNEQPSFFAAFPRFEPELPERLPGDSLAYLGIGSPRTAVAALLEQARDSAPAIASGFRNLVESLEDEVDLERDLLDSLGGEAAFALQPREAEAGPALPFLEFVANDVDEDAATRALAALQRPLAEAVDPSVAGIVPGFEEVEIEGVEAHALRMSPTIELTYAVFDGLAAIATDPEGVAQLAGDGGGLEEDSGYEEATDDFDDEVSLLGYFDLEELVVTGEQLGLAEDPLYATFAGEFRRLDALGIAVSYADELLATDARLLLNEPDEGESGSIPGAGASD